MVEANVRGRDVESVVKDIQQTLDAKLKLPEGYYINYGGQFQNLQEAKDRLQLAVPVALLLIFFLLFLTFRSVKEAVIIFSAIPLAAIGGIVALWMRGMNFSISAGVGFIALFGVAVLNGIVLISYYNRLKEEGEEDITEQDSERQCSQTKAGIWQLQPLHHWVFYRWHSAPVPARKFKSLWQRL